MFEETKAEDLIWDGSQMTSRGRQPEDQLMWNLDEGRGLQRSVSAHLSRGHLSLGTAEMA